MPETGVAVETASAAVAGVRVSRRMQLVAELLLVLVCFFWGSTFVLVKEAVAEVPVTPFLAIRFFLSGLLLCALFARRLLRLDRRTLLAGMLLGAVLFVAYALQTFGLQRTSAANAGFITGLSVVLVPLFAALVFRVQAGAGAWLGVGLATVGLYLLSTDPAGWPGTARGASPGAVPGAALGDLLVLGCAVGFAWHILLTGRFARAFDPRLIAAVQVTATGLLAAAAAYLYEGGIPLALPAVVWWAVAITSLFATVFAFLVQTIAQRFTSPTRTALIFTMEPVFAAVFAWFYAGEPFTRWDFLGGALVVLGMIAAELAPERGGKASAA